MFAARLQPGDEIRIIAPSVSLEMIKEEQLEIAQTRMNQLGFHITFGENVHKHDEFYSTSIEDRISDLHQAFSNPKVKGILTAIGGYNSNQLLKKLDYELIRQHPKIFCGFGDITALNLAIYQKTGLVTYSGPHFSDLGLKGDIDYTLEMFLNAVTNDAPYEIYPATHWSDDPWHIDQNSREWISQRGFDVFQMGNATGRLIGGNLSTVSLLQGTEFMPSLKNSILFIEDDVESHPQRFERAFQSLLQQKDADGITAILIGRFQKESNMTQHALQKIIATQKDIAHIPIITNINFGHTQPMATIPIGSKACIMADENEVEITIEQVE